MPNTREFYHPIPGTKAIKIFSTSRENISPPTHKVRCGVSLNFLITLNQVLLWSESGRGGIILLRNFLWKECENIFKESTASAKFKSLSRPKEVKITGNVLQQDQIHFVPLSQDKTCSKVNFVAERKWERGIVTPWAPIGANKQQTQEIDKHL